MADMGSHDVHSEHRRKWFVCTGCTGEYSSESARDACEDGHLTELRTERWT